MDFANGIMRHRADVTAVDYSSNNRWLAVARKDGLVQVFARLEGFGNAEVRVLGDVACMAFRPETGIAKTDADQFLVGAIDGTIHLFLALHRQGTTVQCQSLAIIARVHREQVT